MDLKFRPDTQPVSTQKPKVNPQRSERVKAAKARSRVIREEKKIAFAAEFARLRSLTDKELLHEITSKSWACLVAFLSLDANGGEVLQLAVKADPVLAAGMFDHFHKEMTEQIAYVRTRESWNKKHRETIPHVLSYDAKRDIDLGRYDRKHPADFAAMEMERRAVASAAVILRESPTGRPWSLALREDCPGFIAGSGFDRYGSGLAYMIEQEVHRQARKGQILPQTSTPIGDNVTAPPCEHDYVDRPNGKGEWCRKCGVTRTAEKAVPA